MHRKNAIAAYDQGSINLEVEAASPHKLIVLLYDGAIKALVMAKSHLARQEVGEKGKAISKAIAIIDEGLRLSLDHNGENAELAGKLDSLYEYMTLRLLEANLQNDEQILDEVSNLLIQLRQAWIEISQAKPAPGPADAAQAGPDAAQAGPDAGRKPESYGRV